MSKQSHETKTARLLSELIVEEYRVKVPHTQLLQTVISHIQRYPGVRITKEERALKIFEEVQKEVEQVGKDVRKAILKLGYPSLENSR